jgi:hypothetical protein
MSKIWMTRLGVLVLALGLIYGGLDIAGAAPGGPGPPAQTVVVDNTATNPVPVQQQGTATVTFANSAIKTSAADNPAFQPVVVNKGTDDSLGVIFEDLYTVPAGKELVITNISAQVGVPQATDFSDLHFNSEVGGQVGVVYLPATKIGSDSSHDISNGTSMTQIYGDPGTHVGCAAQRNSAQGDFLLNCSFEGYLVDLPS